MEDNKNKRIEEYFTSFQNIDLISEGPKKQGTIFPNNNSTKQNEYQPKKYNPTDHDDGTISKGSSINLNKIKQNEYQPKEYNPINNDNEISSRGTTIKNTNNINIEKTKNNSNTPKKAIQKSKSKIEIKKKNKKGRKITGKIVKSIVISAISIILISYSADKIYTHYQTEQITKETIIQTYEELEDLGYNKENINIDEILENSEPEYLKENIYELYLIINENIESKDRAKYYNKLVQKAGLANTFDRYLINEGYHYSAYNSSTEPGTHLEGSHTKWENANEARLLAEKTLHQNKGAR